MDYRILGPLTACQDGRPLALGSPKQRNLLAALLLSRNTVVPVDRLVDILWDDAPPKTALTALHGLVCQLRRGLSGCGAGPVIVTRPPGYLIEIAPGQLDLDEFERLAGLGRSALSAGLPAEASGHFSAALALWSGPALGGVTADRLLRTEGARLEERRLAVLEDRIDADLAAGQHAELVPELASLVAGHPLRERLRGQQMIALHRAGRRADALAGYRAARALLVDQLGLEPGEELRKLERAILLDDPALAAPRDAPAHVPRAPAQLPPGAADFTGRAALLAELCDRVGGGGSDAGTAPAVAAISGKPGVGKTATAVHVGHLLRERFPDGQLYVNLHGTEARRLDPAAVLEEWLRVLGVPPEAIPADAEARARMYRGRVAGRCVLVLLDDAADEAQVRPLLPGTGGCSVLVTSRRRLAGLESASFVTLPPLEQSEAVELLGRVAGSGRAAAEPAAARAIAERCGRLRWRSGSRARGCWRAITGHWRC